MESFSLGNLLMGLIVSTLGIAYIRLAKIHGKLGYLFCGLAMLIIPYLPIPLWLAIAGSAACVCYPMLFPEA